MRKGAPPYGKCVLSKFCNTSVESDVQPRRFGKSAQPLVHGICIVRKVIDVFYRFFVYCAERFQFLYQSFNVFQPHVRAAVLNGDFDICTIQADEIEISFVFGEEVERDELQPGDLVFYNTRRRRYSHVGIYLGDNKFIHAPSSGKTVRIDNMEQGYWKNRFNGARRIADPGAKRQIASEKEKILQAFRDDVDE